MEDQSFDERLSQFSKRQPSFRGKKARSYRLFRLRQILNFLLNLIVSNLAAINLTSIKLTSVTSSFAVTTNPDYTLLGLC